MTRSKKTSGDFTAGASKSRKHSGDVHKGTSSHSEISTVNKESKHRSREVSPSKPGKPLTPNKSQPASPVADDDANADDQIPTDEPAFTMSGISLARGDVDIDEEEDDDLDVRNNSPVASILDIGADDDGLYNDDEDFQPSVIFKERGYIRLLTHFDNVISELDNARVAGVPMEEVKELFFTTWSSVDKSHQNEMDLVRKDRDISIILADTMAKTKILIKLAHNDTQLAQRLGRRLEAAWSLVDIGEAEERKNTHKIETLREEIFQLNRNISAAANLEGLDQVNDLVKLKKKLTEERDALFKEAGKLRTVVTNLREKKAQQIERKLQFQEMIKISADEAVAQKEAISRETSRKETILVGIEEAAQQLEVKEEELLQLGKKVLHGQQKIEELERGVREQKYANEAAIREAELSSNRIDKLRQDFELQTQLVERMTMEALARSQDFKSLEDDINNIKIETHRVSRLRSTNTKRHQALEEHLANLESERESLKGRITVLEKDLEAAQKKLEENRRHVEELDKERTLVNRNLQRAVAISEEHDSQGKIHAAAVTNLQSELQAFEREIKNQQKAIDKIESERNFYLHEAIKLTSYAALGMEQVKKVSAHVFEIRKRVGEIQEEYKKVQQLYEMAVNEKLNSEKMLRELEINILNTDLKVKYKVFELSTANYQLCDKEKIYASEMEKRERIARQTKFFTEQKKRVLGMIHDVQKQTDSLEADRATLGCMIAEAESELAKQKYFRNAAESRKTNYQRKLMTKDHELKEVFEKWRTLNSQVRIGNYHYRRIMKEIREMRQNLVNIRRIQFYFKNNVNHVNELRQEIAVLENCISKEICMINDLNDQLKRPKNVHRWRSLEALNPEAYDMVRKINLVTNRLVERNADILTQSQIMKAKEEILVEIQKLLRRSPGLETPEERLYFEHLVLAKERQFDTLTRELKTAEGQTEYYRKEVVKLNNVYQRVRREYFAAKKEELRTGVKWSVKDASAEIESLNEIEEEDIPEEIEEEMLKEEENIVEEAEEVEVEHIPVSIKRSVLKMVTLPLPVPIKEKSLLEYDGEGAEPIFPFMSVVPVTLPVYTEE